MYTKKISSLLILLLLISLHKIYAQNTFIDPRNANSYYTIGDYKDALNLYKKLLEQSPENGKYHYKIGVCYLKTNIDKTLAIPHFEWMLKHSRYRKREVRYELGVAYHYAGRFEEAIKIFENYRDHAGRANRLKADKQIEECKTALELMKNPVNVTFTNLGDEINSSYPDYYPLVSGDGTELIFTTRRPTNRALPAEMDGYYSSDIYISHEVNGVWQKAKSIGSQINTVEDEEAVGLNSSATQLVLYKDNVIQDGRIYYCEKRGNTYCGPKCYPISTVNKGFQSSGDISQDGKILFFASERPGGYGGMDIYIIRKKANGRWGEPQNLGENINTKYNEDFPTFDVGFSCLYFSSQGHNTMGDYDLFESKWDTNNNEWSAAMNLGYPINTPDDDRSISFTKDHRKAYVSRIRPDGKGDWDVYMITFNEEQKIGVIKPGNP